MPYDKKTQQAEILSTETSSNENMPYTRLEITNKGLNPDRFPGALSKVVNAINMSYERAESARNYGKLLYEKFARIILDPSGSYGKSKIEEMIEKTGETTLIEAICSLCSTLESGEGVNVTVDTIINALGYTPMSSMVGYILEEEKEPVEDSTIIEEPIE